MTRVTRGGEGGSFACIQARGLSSWQDTKAHPSLRFSKRAWLSMTKFFNARKSNRLPCAMEPESAFRRARLLIRFTHEAHAEAQGPKAPPLSLKPWSRIVQTSWIYAATAETGTFFPRVADSAFASVIFTIPLCNTAFAFSGSTSTGKSMERRISSFLYSE